MLSMWLWVERTATHRPSNRTARVFSDYLTEVLATDPEQSHCPSSKHRFQFVPVQY